MTDLMCAKRLVLHVGGYDFLTPEAAYGRFRRELRRFEHTWSAQAIVSKLQIGVDQAAWSIVTSGPNWRVETEFRLVRWDDLIEAAGRWPMWRRLILGLLAFADFVAAGALWRYLHANWRYAGFFLYPFVLLAIFIATAAILGVVVADMAGSSILGVLAAGLAAVIIVRWPGRRLHIAHLFDDWIFSRGYIRRLDPTLDARLQRLAFEIGSEGRTSRWDEILIVGHSLGAVLSVDLLDRVLRLDPSFGQRSAPRVAFVSVGSSILKIGLHRAAQRFRAAAAQVASSPGVFWAEYQALSDIMNFYKTDPIAAMGLPARDSPVVRVVRISRMLDAAVYRRIRRNFFRVHNQFVSGNNRRATYDYFMLVCGPFAVERLARSPDGAASAIGPDGTLLLIENNPEAAFRPCASDLR